MLSVVSYPLTASREFVELCAPVRRIVTVHSGSLRELLFVLPALRTLRETFEGAHLAAAVREGLAPLLESCSLVDEVLARPEGGLSSHAQLMARLHALHADVAIAFSASRNGVLLVWSSGAHVRLGFDGAKMDALLTHRVMRETDEDKPESVTTIEDYLNLTRALGCAPRCHDYAKLIRPPVEDERKVGEWLAQRAIEKEFIVLAPQPERRPKRKPSKRNARGAEDEVERWAQTALALEKRASVILWGSQPQLAVLTAALTAAREAAGGREVKIFDAGGAFGILAQAALFERARLFIGSCSATSHLAAAMSTPVISMRVANGKNECLEADEPRGVAHRMLSYEAAPQEIAQAALKMIGL